MRNLISKLYCFQLSLTFFNEDLSNNGSKIRIMIDNLNKYSNSAQILK